MYKRVYIIGNGFDLHHEIDCSYNDFKEYLKINDNNLFLTIENYFYYNDNFWNQFEKSLADLNIFSIIYDWQELFPFWYHSYKHNYQFNDSVANEIECLRKGIKANFIEWVKNLNRASYSKKISIDTSNSFFINFNYTNTLEYIYRIQPKNILYLHGNIHNSSEIIIGHSLRDQFIDDSIYNNSNILLNDAYEHLNNYLHHYRKPVEYLIAKYKSIFKSLESVKEVYLLGHSLSCVDMPYIKEVYESISKETKWVISYYNQNDISIVKKRLSELNVLDSHYKIIKFSNLESEFYPKLFNDY